MLIVNSSEMEPNLVKQHVYYLQTFTQDGKAYTGQDVIGKVWGVIIHWRQSSYSVKFVY